ncbi:MAG: hypothetical protein H6863_04995 [Rhodospirillales bacterium]|nr:hypothetical protein [Rhodospirillales bacterium]MCB9980473.1 hypothetical protein [Rhodospirillales bacterium]
MKLSVLAAILLTLGFVTNITSAQAADASVACSFSYEGLKGGTDVKTFIGTVEALGFSKEGRVTNPTNYTKSTPDYIYHVNKSIAGTKNVSVVKTLLNRSNSNWKNTAFASDIKSIKDRYCTIANASPKSHCNETETTFNLSLSYERTPPLSNCNLLVGYANGQFTIKFGY